MEHRKEQAAVATNLQVAANPATQPAEQENSSSTPKTSRHGHAKQSFFQSLPTMVKYYGVCCCQSIVELTIYSVGQMFFAEHVANSIAVVCACCLQFLLNRNVTFKSSSNIARSLVRFILLWIWNYCFSTTMISILPGMLGVHSIVIKVCTMMCQGLWGYFLCKHVIFK